MRKVSSKSLISNRPNIPRTLVNPVEKSYSYNLNNSDSNNPFASNHICSDQTLQFDQALLNSLNQVELDYVEKMALRQYQSISQDMNIYLSLENQIFLNMVKTKNTNLKLLLQIARDGLTGAFQSRGMNTEITELMVKNALLEKKNDDILSGKNETAAMSDTCGEFVITKTFKLSAVYNYYIMLYGLPVFGVGFDTSKLTLLADILRNNGVDPFR